MTKTTKNTKTRSVKTKKESRQRTTTLESKILKPYYSTGKYIYKRFHKVLSLADMKKKDELQWFSLTSNYGSEENYGRIVHTYRVKKKPRLINIGLDSIRKLILDRVQQGENRNLGGALTANTQWSGGTANKIYNNYVRKYFPNYDGTIIVSEPPDGKPTALTLDEENDGATEIVLWQGFSEFLVRV